MEYARSAAGEAELSARSLPLSIPTRRLLGMIVGTQTSQSLAVAVRFGDLERMLHELVERGLIIGVQDQSQPSPVKLGAPADAPDSAATGVPASVPIAPVVGMSAEQATAVRRLAARFIYDSLGPNGEKLALQVERATDLVALENACYDARRILFEFRGRAIADSFYETVIVPAFGASG